MSTAPSHIKNLWKGQFLLFLLALTALFAFAQDPEIRDSVIVQDAQDSSYMVEESAEYKFEQTSIPDTSRYLPYSIPDSALEALREDDAFWYANLAPKAKEVANPVYKKPFYIKKWFKNLVWVLIVVSFIGVLIWFLIASDVKLFRKKPKPVTTAGDGLLPDDIFSIDYENELRKAVLQGEFRLGVRLMYLDILRLMAEREIIAYKIERTNSDYLQQVYQTAHYKDFFRLTRNFEYAWYGKFSIGEMAFNKIRQDYLNLKKGLES